MSDGNGRKDPRRPQCPRDAEPRPEDLPARLSQQPGAAGDLVRRYLRRPHAVSESRAFARLDAAWPGGAPAHGRWPRLALAALAGLAVAATSLLLLVARPSPQQAAVAPPAPTSTGTIAIGGAATGSSTAAGAAILTLAPTARAIAPGRWRISEEAQIELSPGSAALAEHPSGGSPALSLERGQLTLVVQKKPRPAPFRVLAGPFTFTVLGTEFSVARGPGRVSLAVTEGRVAVSRAGRRLAVVAAGGGWSGDPRPAPRRPPPACAERGVRPGPAMLACLRAEAAGAGLRAQIALFHIGRIHEEDLREPSAALATFEELRRRFPRGPLRPESDLSIVELLAVTGRHAEALDESAALLARGSSAERTTELRMLRGDLYRKRADLVHAEREYRLATDAATGVATAATPTADEALFLHAETLAALGRRGDAIARYRGYLERARPLRAAEARAHLARLEQTSAPQAGSK